MIFQEMIEKIDLTPEKRQLWIQIYDMLNEKGKEFLEESFEKLLNEK